MEEDEVQVVPSKKEPQSCKFGRRLLAVFKSQLTLILVFIGYSFGGAALFQWLEAPQETAAILEMRQLREDMLDKLWNAATQDSSNHTNTSWKEMAWVEITKLESQGRNVLQPSMKVGSEEPVWNFWSAMLFCGTIYTTIGYGTIVPKTKYGRAACIGYAILGIPLCMTILARMGRLMAVAIRKLNYHLWRLLQCAKLVPLCIRGCKCCKRRRRRGLSRTGGVEDDDSYTRRGRESEDEMVNISGEDDEGLTEEEAFEPSPLFPVMVLLAYMFFGAYMYTIWEKEWDYFSSWYFIFVSITTIGFGDITPEHQKFFIAASLYIFIGFVLLSTVINTVITTAKIAMKKASRAHNIMQQNLQMTLRRGSQEFLDKLNAGIDSVKKKTKSKDSDAGSVDENGQVAVQKNRPMRKESSKVSFRDDVEDYG